MADLIVDLILEPPCGVNSSEQQKSVVGKEEKRGGEGGREGGEGEVGRVRNRQ